MSYRKFKELRILNWNITRGEKKIIYRIKWEMRKPKKNHHISEEEKNRSKGESETKKCGLGREMWSDEWIFEEETRHWKEEEKGKARERRKEIQQEGKIQKESERERERERRRTDR